MLIQNILTNYHFRHLPPGRSTQNLMSEDFSATIYARQMQERQQTAQQRTAQEKLSQQQPSVAEHADTESTKSFTKDTVHSIYLAIPSLGKGFEHLYGNTPKVGNLIEFFNDQGFVRAVPFKMPKIKSTEREEGSGKSMTPEASQASLCSATSSNSSLTSSQRDVFGIEDKSKWPLGSQKSVADM